MPPTKDIVILYIYIYEIASAARYVVFCLSSFLFFLLSEFDWIYYDHATLGLRMI